MKNILLAATALAMLSGAAFAQSTSNSGSNASATNLSGSMSSANVSSTGASSATTNVYLPSDPADPNAGSQNLNYGGSYTVRNTPDVIAPNVVGGNPCAVGASGGIGLPGFGLSAGGTWADKACELRQKVALLYNMGEPAVARELMCQDDPKLRAAMQRLGKPCGVDLAGVQAPAPAAPTIAPAAAPAHTAAVPVTKGKPEWCKRASPSTEASREYFVKECT